MPSESCAEELETLSAIFLNEIQIKDDIPNGESQVTMVLYPATADDEESRYVTLTLELTLPPSYPKQSPNIVFRNPRGLNEDMLDDLMKCMKERCEEKKESQMVYELIDMGQEFLTKNNRPASECPICLLSFTEFDVFYRTKCFHHFHSKCLGNYLQNLANSFKEEANVLKEKQELTCPVCRECLEENIDIDKLIESPPPSEELENSGGQPCTVLEDWEGKREVMKRLYEKQKSQGGIIDLTEGKKLLVISTERDGESQGSARNDASGSTNAASGGGNNPPAAIPSRQNDKGRGGRQQNTASNSSNTNVTAKSNRGESDSQPQHKTREKDACPDSKTGQHNNGNCRKGGGYYNRRRYK